MSKKPEASDRTFESLTVGESVSTSHTITESVVQAFAELSGDHNPLHTNPAYAKETLFGKPIAHGMLLASFVSELVGMSLPGKRCLLVKETLEFKLPVFYGDTVRVVGTLMHKSASTGLLDIEIKIERESTTVALGSVVARVM